MTHEQLTALANAASDAQKAYEAAQEAFINAHASHRVGDVINGKRSVRKARGFETVVAPMKVQGRRVSSQHDGTWAIAYWGFDDKTARFHMHAIEIIK